MSEIGVAERFRPGDYERVEQVLADVARLGVRRLRTLIAFQEFRSSLGRAWVEWLLPALAARTEVLPSLTCHAGPSGADLAGYEEFPAALLAAGGAYCSWLEVAPSPIAAERDPRLSPEGAALADTLGNVVAHAHSAGKRIVLGGALVNHEGWLELLAARGVLQEVDAIGLHGFPSAEQLDGNFWPARVERLRATLTRHGSHAQIWLTEAGLRGEAHDEHARLRALLETVDAAADRVYWSSTCLPPGKTEPEHAGALHDRPGRPRAVARLFAEGGVPRLRTLDDLAARRARGDSRGVTLVIGGAGFIGTNLAARLLADGRRVRVFDNLSRAGAERNLEWLATQFPDGLEFRFADVRNGAAVEEAVADVSEVFHFAAQVAVTTSLDEPLQDFEANARGTLNVLEALRKRRNPPPLVFTSTNKVYGGLDSLALTEEETRYVPADRHLADNGFDESHPLSFCSPYGCSKGAADQYVLDYARTYELNTLVLRMSCIYGPHQFGNEDQGWVAHFLRRSLSGEPISIFGDGRQVRDLLFVEDLVDALLLARDRIEALRGQAFNIGGGIHNTISLLELLERMAQLNGAAPQARFESWRASDQRWYVSNVNRFSAATGWHPRVSVIEGIARLHQWLAAQQPSATPAQPGRVAR